MQLSWFTTLLRKYSKFNCSTLFFDHSADTFESLKEWRNEIENNTDRDVITYLVGNRADLED